MDDMRLPRMDENSTVHVVGKKFTEHQYVVVLGKSHGGMRFHYAMIDPETKTIIPKLNTIIWSRLVDTMEFATCVFKNCLYVIGGIEKSTGKVCSVVQKYDPYVGRWKQCGDMCKPRARFTAAAIYGKLFVFGGMTSPTAISDTCESYEPLFDEWKEEEFKLPEARKDHSCVVNETNVYIIGGVSRTKVANNNVWVLSQICSDPRNLESCVYEWSLLPDPAQTEMGYCLFRHASVLCNDRMYILGGVANGRTIDGRRVLRQISQPDILRVHQNEIDVCQSQMSVSDSNTSPENLHQNGSPVKKMLIATSSIIESYRFHVLVPDFGIEADLEEASVRQKDEEEKRKQKSRKRQRNRKRKRISKEDFEKEYAEQQAEEERAKLEEEEKKAEKVRSEKIKRKSWWKTNIPGMVFPRCAAGTVVLGNKIYVIGGHKVEDQENTHVSNIECFHTKRNEWTSAFDIGDEGDFSSVECAVLTIPKYNKDFRPMKYSGCKWVMW